MAQSQVALYNIAIAACGGTATLTATSDSVIEAEMCELFYENVRQVALRSMHWNSCKRYARLVEEAERDTSAAWVSTDPEPGYGFSYDLPANYLHARYLTDFSVFEIGYETDQKILSCNIGGSDADEDPPVLCYTIDVTDVTIWEPDLYMAIAYALSAHISMPLHAKPARAKENIALANSIIETARVNNANEMQRLFDKRPDSLGQRGYSYGAITPYVFPYGALYSNPGAGLT